MHPFIKFLIAGTLFVLVPELTNIVIINKSWGNFFMAIAFYWVILALGFFVARTLRHIIRSPSLFFFVYAIITGSFGLFVVEWNFVGNSPWKNPAALQYGMFVYWMALYMFSLIFSEKHKAYKPLKKNLAISYSIYSIAHLIFSLSFVANTWVLIVFVPGLWTIVYTIFGVYYWWYVSISRKVALSKSF